MGNGDEDGWAGFAPAPNGGPLYLQKDDHWTHFDNSVNAVSFGFVATAILISMFLVMAVFEKFLRSTESVGPVSGRTRFNDVEAQTAHGAAGFGSKHLGYPSPKISTNAKEVSVVMPGNNVPTFLANPAPVPCPPERMTWPSHQRPADSPTASSIS